MINTLKLLSRWSLPSAAPACLSSLGKCWIQSMLRDFCTILCCIQCLGHWNGPLQTAQGIREVKSCSEKLDFILSDPTEFLTDSGQGTKQELCRWLWFAWLCLAVLLSAGWDLKNEKKWKSRWQTEMPSPLTVSHSWLWRGVCQNRCQCCLVLFFKISVFFISML